MRFWICTSFGVLLSLANSGAFSHAQSPATASRDQLQQYVTQLQANPTDDALRTKIIQLALTLDPKPAVPDAAAIDAAKGKTIFASAGSPDDVKAAAAAFAEASQLAPWVPDYYYNEGLALEKAKQYDDAIHALTFYLLAAPNAADANEARGRIEGIRYEKQKTAQDAATEQAKAQEAEKVQATRFAGRWCRGNNSYLFEISGSDGSYSAQLSPTEAHHVDYPGGGHTVYDTRLQGFSISGNHLTFREAVHLHMVWGDGFAHDENNSWDYDLTLSPGGEVLSGNEIKCGEECAAPTGVQLSRCE